MALSDLCAILTGMKRYDPTDIEQKWQVIWERDGTYTVDLDDTSKPKYCWLACCGHHWCEYSYRSWTYVSIFRHQGARQASAGV